MGKHAQIKKNVQNTELLLHNTAYSSTMSVGLPSGRFYYLAEYKLTTMITLTYWYGEEFPNRNSVNLQQIKDTNKGQRNQRNTFQTRYIVDSE